MALSLLQKNQLTTATQFLARVTQAVRERAAYRLIGGGEPTQTHIDWAKRALLSNRASQIAADCAGQLVTDGAFDSVNFSGSSPEEFDVDITDQNLKVAVEAYCENY